MNDRNESLAGLMAFVKTKGAQRLLIIVAIALTAFLFFQARFRGGEPSDTHDHETQLFFIDNKEAVSDKVHKAARYEEVSIADKQVVVLTVSDFKPGKHYSASLTIRDASGKKIDYDKNQINFTADGEEFLLWWNTLSFDPTEYEPGTWKYEVEIKGYGTIKKTMNVLAPTESESVLLAQEEQSREYIFRAFSNYWLGLDDGSYITGAEPRSGPSAGGSSSLRSAVHSGVSYLQIANVSHIITKDLVSAADRLNGVTYRGRAKFNFTVFRPYATSSGWAKWYDVERPRHHAENVWETHFSNIENYYSQYSNSISEPALTPALAFEVYEQDGNWFVRSDQGHTFVNGQYKKGVRADTVYKFQRPAALNHLYLDLHLDQEAITVVETGKNPRRDAKLMANLEKGSPKKAEENTLKTMRMLRGRSL